jgi:hypothetical protein
MKEFAMTDVIETNLFTHLPFSPSSPKPPIIKSYVEGLFKEDAPSRKGESRQNPVHGGWFVHGEDPIAPQKRKARRALLAREWFYEFGPHDVPPLPLSHWEIDDMRYKNPFDHLIASFAVSLRRQDYDVNIHPSFEDYASSVLVSDYAPDFLKNDEDLCKRYPPRAFCTIGRGLCWEPPEVNESNRRIIARRK